MNISKINNVSQNFGLRKSNKYQALENQLIKQIDNPSNDDKIIFSPNYKPKGMLIANEITKLVPGALLDYNPATDRIILKDDKQGNTYLSEYDLCGVNRKNPYKTLDFLYRQLLEFFDKPWTVKDAKFISK